MKRLTLEQRFIRAYKPGKFVKAQLAADVQNITQRNCSRQTVFNWCKRGWVGDDEVRAVHRITGIPVRFLRKQV